MSLLGWILRMLGRRDPAERAWSLLGSAGATWPQGNAAGVSPALRASVGANPRVVIGLPTAAGAAGVLHAEEGGGRVLGPFRAAGTLAAPLPAGWANRDGTAAVLRNVPAGAYRVRELRPTAGATPEVLRELGAACIAILEAVSGDAAAADAAGRGEIGIHGGVPGVAGGLRPGHNSIRLADPDMAQLAAYLAARPGLPVTIGPAADGDTTDTDGDSGWDTSNGETDSFFDRGSPSDDAAAMAAGVAVGVAAGAAAGEALYDAGPTRAGAYD